MERVNLNFNLVLLFRDSLTFQGGFIVERLPRRYENGGDSLSVRTTVSFSVLRVYKYPLLMIGLRPRFYLDILRWWEISVGI